MMKTITVIELIGNPCLLAPDKGSVLASWIIEALNSSSKLKVDFTGYEFLSSTFLNHAFGQLCINQNWDIQTFHKKVNVVGLSEDDVDELALALDNAQMRRELIVKGVDPAKYYASRVPA